MLVSLLGLGSCSLFVETEDLQQGSEAQGGEPATSTPTNATGGGSTASTTMSNGGGGGGGAEDAGAGGEAGGGGAPGTGGAGGDGPTWCAANAPVDAFLCADFDTPSTGLTSPPWSNATFEDADGSVTLDEADPRSAPGAARIELTGAEEPNCGYQVLQRNIPGDPARIEIRFALRGEVTDGEDVLVALFDWQTTDDTPCSLILGLGANRGFLLEQAFAMTSYDDQWNNVDSYLSGWHEVVWSIDLDEGTVEIAVDGQPSFFVGHDDYVYDLGVACGDVAEPNTIHVRLGPHCEAPPITLLVDDVIIAPW